jgi:hypothetical protein
MPFMASIASHIAPAAPGRRAPGGAAPQKAPSTVALCSRAAQPDCTDSRWIDNCNAKGQLQKAVGQRQ